MECVETCWSQTGALLQVGVRLLRGLSERRAVSQQGHHRHQFANLHGDQVCAHSSPVPVRAHARHESPIQVLVLATHCRRSALLDDRRRVPRLQGQVSAKRNTTNTSSNETNNAYNFLLLFVCTLCKATFCTALSRSPSHTSSTSRRSASSRSTCAWR